MSIYNASRLQLFILQKGQKFVRQSNFTVWRRFINHFCNCNFGLFAQTVKTRILTLRFKRLRTSTRASRLSDV